MRIALLLVPAALLGAASLWMLADGSAPRIPPGWSWRSSFVGTQTLPDPETGRFPDENALGIYERTIMIGSDAGRPGSIILEDDFIIRDPMTGEVTWRYTVYPTIDPATGRHLHQDGQGDFIVLPRGVERRTYPFRMNYIEGIPLSFIAEETIEGLDVFLFGYEGRGEYTASYGGTKDYAGVPVEVGQEIRCADDRFSFYMWVEPVTGEAIKIAERCDGGDYIFDTATDERLAPVLRWGGETAGIDVLRRVNWVRSERRLLLVSRYLPLILAGLAIILAVAAFARWRARS